jgi:WhiB family transcriptional regulator, redox-sensing transcriptional regulator
MTTTPDARVGTALARDSVSFHMRAEGRLFHTKRQLPCHDDPDLFFNARKRRQAISKCGDCPFRGRCGYNAVTMGATHGIWGGVILPGDYPRQLKPVYARLADQFEQRRRVELGDIPVAPLPDPDPDLDPYADVDSYERDRGAA